MTRKASTKGRDLWRALAAIAIAVSDLPNAGISDGACPFRGSCGSRRPDDGLRSGLPSRCVSGWELRENPLRPNFGRRGLPRAERI